MINFEKVMGLEIHIELNTKTKMFSSSPNRFNDEPNTNISPVDMGYPGSLPVVNKEAIVSAIKLAKSLGMEISREVKFDRKNYLYPDLPKGYQITQFYEPIGKNGKLKLTSGLEVLIERIQLEEDTAKSTKVGDTTMLDFNRSGVPLIEIITEPIFRNSEEVKEYVELLQVLVRRLGISDAKMEEGSFRVDLNISIRLKGDENLNNRVEIKNINTVSNIMKAIDFEFTDQSRKYLEGDAIKECTKRYDEDSKSTVIMRFKDDNLDYKFIPEPNIPVIYLPTDVIEGIEIPSLPTEDYEMLIGKGVSEEYANQLYVDIDLQNYFLSIIKEDANSKKINEADKPLEWNDVAKLFFAEVVSLANSKGVSPVELGIKPFEIMSVIHLIDQGIISGKQAKTIIPLLINGEKTALQVIEEKDLKLISDPVKLKDMINNIATANEEFIKNNIERRERVEKFILGELMKSTRGQANPVVSAKLAKDKMGEYV